MNQGQGLSFKLKLKKSSKVVNLGSITNNQYVVLDAFTKHDEVHAFELLENMYGKLPKKLRPKNINNGLHYVIKRLNDKLYPKGLIITGINRGPAGKTYWIEKI